MTFLNPWMLAGVAAIALPIVIHMLMRRRSRPMRWAAMRFLEVVVRRNESRLRVENLLLLLMRCLLLALVALALARPAVNAMAGLATGGSRTVILALDNSASMGAGDGTATRFENAKKAAGEILDRLPPGSRAALLLYSDVSTPVIPEPAPDLALVRKLIAEAKLTDRASDAQPVVSDALDIVARRAGGDAEIYLITDAQATGWRELAAMRSQAAQTRARFTIVIPSPEPKANLGVSDIAMTSPLTPVGVAARFSVQVTNYGATEARDVAVSLSIDTEPPGDQAVIASIPARESRRVSLFAKPGAVGCHTITARIPGDALPADDARAMVIRAVDQVRVLLVAGTMGGEPRDGDAFFLERALAPVPADARDTWYIKPRVVAAADLPNIDPGDYDAVALIDVPAVEPATAAALERYVRQGGGVMIFPGDLTDAGAFDETMGAILPARYGAAWSGTGADYRVLQGTGYAHPVTSPWSDPGSGTLATARFYKALTLEKGGDMVLAFANGMPAIVERVLGAGRVIQFASSANAAWNDLPGRPAYLPLMQRVLGRLVTTRDGALNITTGAPFACAAPPDWLYKAATVTPPGGAARARAAVSLAGGQPALRFAETDHAGTYAVAVDASPPVRFAFAARLPPEESSLDALPDASLRSLAPGTRIVRWSAAGGLRQGLAGGVAGRELWDILAALALAAACCEMWMAGRFSASR